MEIVCRLIIHTLFYKAHTKCVYTAESEELNGIYQFQLSFKVFLSLKITLAIIAWKCFVASLHLYAL